MILSMQLKNRAVTQYTGLSINSACVFNGKVVFAGNGIFTHEGDTDDGVNIDAYAEVPHSADLFRPRRVWISGEGGSLVLTLSLDESNPKVYVLEKAGQKRKSVPVERVTPGNLLTLKVANAGGSDFSVDSIDVEKIKVSRR